MVLSIVSGCLAWTSVFAWYLVLDPFKPATIRLVMTDEDPPGKAPPHSEATAFPIRPKL